MPSLEAYDIGTNYIYVEITGLAFAWDEYDSFRFRIDGGPWRTFQGDYYEWTGLTQGTWYRFDAQAKWDGVWYDAGSCRERTLFSSKPTAPTSFNVFTYDTEADLSWSGARYVDYYEVYLNNYYECQFDESDSQGVIWGLVENTSYTFKICAVNDIGEACKTVSMATMPGDPYYRNGSVVNKNQIKINFDKGYSAQYTEFYWNTSGNWPSYNATEDFRTTSSSTFTLTGLPYDSEISVWIRARGSRGRATEWELCDYFYTDPAPLPSKPTGLKIDSVNTDSITLKWDASTYAEYYQIQWRKYNHSNNTWGNWQNWATVNINSYTLNGCTTGTSYEFRIRSVNDTGTSGYITGGTTTRPNKPTNLTSTSRTSNSITLSVTPGSGRYSGFRVETSKGGSLVSNTNIVGTTGSITGLEPSTWYVLTSWIYVDTAFGTKQYSGSIEPPISGEYAISSTTGAAIQPPASLTVTTQSTSSIKLSWPGVSGATGYNIYRDEQYFISTTATTYTITSLVANTTYELCVSAYVDTYDNESTKVCRQGSTVYVFPPTNISIDVIGLSISITFTKGTGAVTTVMDPDWLTGTQSTSGISFSFTVPTLNKTYNFELASIDQYGNYSNWTDTYSFTTSRPLDWDWNPSLVVDKRMPVTSKNGKNYYYLMPATEWNDFLTRINQFRTVVAGLTAVNFKTYVSDDKIDIDMYNDIALAINAMSSHFTGGQTAIPLKTINTGKLTYADLQKLKNTLNSIY